MNMCWRNGCETPREFPEPRTIFKQAPVRVCAPRTYAWEILPETRDLQERICVTSNRIAMYSALAQGGQLSRKVAEELFEKLKKEMLALEAEALEMMLGNFTVPAPVSNER